MKKTTEQNWSIDRQQPKETKLKTITRSVPQATKKPRQLLEQIQNYNRVQSFVTIWLLPSDIKLRQCRNDSSYLAVSAMLSSLS